METQQEYKMTKYEWEIMLKELQARPAGRE